MKKQKEFSPDQITFCTSKNMPESWGLNGEKLVHPLLVRVANRSAETLTDLSVVLLVEDERLRLGKLARWQEVRFDFAFASGALGPQKRAEGEVHFFEKIKGPVVVFSLSGHLEKGGAFYEQRFQAADITRGRARVESFSRALRGCPREAMDGTRQAGPFERLRYWAGCTAAGQKMRDGLLRAVYGVSRLAGKGLG